MPFQESTEVVTGLPWDCLADAHEQLADAERFGDADDVAAARELVAVWQEHLGNLGALLLLKAFEHCPRPLREVLAREFAGAGDEAYRESRRAVKAWRQAREELDAMRCRVKELERRLDSLTPGLGEPGKTL